MSSKVPKSKALEILRKRLSRISLLTYQSADSLEFKRWHKDTVHAIGKVFFPSMEEREEFEKIQFDDAAYIFGDDLDSQEQRKIFLRGLSEAKFMLNSLIERINDFWPQNQELSTLDRSSKEVDRRSISIFVVHGHDKEAKETVARFLQKHQLNVIILHERASKGRTIIEKIEENDDVGYAVVLLTPDDIGAPSDQPKNLRSRARQNVIFEFGYFISKLGRENVCALVVDDIEKPSDYDGVVYIRMDKADGWKLELMRELKSAGIDIDANKELDA